MFNYLRQSTKFDFLARNSRGETPLSLVEKQGSKELKSAMKLEAKTPEEMDAVLAELIKQDEEEHK